jgi:hypothetical protein
LYVVTEINIAKPGNSASHQAYVAPRATDSIDPQLTVVADTPKPRKLKLDSINIAEAIPNAALTITGAIALGSTCLNMVLMFEYPRATAAVT